MPNNEITRLLGQHDALLAQAAVRQSQVVGSALNDILAASQAATAARVSTRMRQVIAAASDKGGEQ